MFVITGWDFVFSSHCCLKRSEEVKVNGQIRETPHISIWGELFILSWKKNNTAVAKLQIPRGRVEWPAKSNFSVCVFTRVALAGGKCIVSAPGSSLCYGSSVTHYVVVWYVLQWCGRHCNGKMFQITCCHAEIYIFESGAGMSNKGLDKSLSMVFCF